MEIIGRGFLARSLGPIAHRHPDTVAVAAGVSWASQTSAADFDRERALIRETACRCRAEGSRLLFFSTAAAAMYGAVDGPAREDGPTRPLNPYGTHKLALEGWLRGSGTRHLTLRLGHLVGPAQPPHQLVPSLVAQVRRGTIRIHRGAVRDLVHVEDAVTLVDHLLERALDGETVNVASGHAAPVAGIVDHLAHRLGAEPRREYLDVGPAVAVAPSICTAKLRGLVPEAAAMGFGPGYHRQVLDRYLGAAGVPPEPVPCR
ncbi:NAD-dependent epimerase/dehydratase [Streptomyces sp. DH-12]|uniref:NAD-dependent epimerase/dehydratase family protein n=1 Tax=unclassified Streptomyces TaxID=2593676 RepID=UPI000CCE38D9|nr:SDR family oxidoreductase [Streptomyces sp. DH-12]PNV30982.1 NAD-dependent epimerase/dehydratase [Streptomyces sp. DH-12]